MGLFAGISKPEHWNKAIPCSRKEEMVELNLYFFKRKISGDFDGCICVVSCALLLRKLGHMAGLSLGSLKLLSRLTNINWPWICSVVMFSIFLDCLNVGWKQK